MSKPPHITTTIPPQQPPQPPPPLPSLHHYHHHHHQQPQLLPSREYRKGNWTIQETLILITAKKLNEEYRSNRNTTTNPTAGGGKLRWNWIEEYCWANGCYRSQNQCNDKWDNLLRDYKKVHRYQQSRSSSSSSSPSPSAALNGSDSYWNMERHERKLHNLPSNMSREVYEALNEVVQRRYNFNNNDKIIPFQHHQQQQQQEEGSGPPDSPTPVTIRQASPVAVAAPPTTEVSEGVDSGDETEESDKSKKRRVGKISSSIKRSGSILAQTLRSCDEMKEKRHQQVMELEQRRLQIEETRNEVHRQGIANFVKAMSNLSDAIHSIISNFNNQT